MRNASLRLLAAALVMIVGLAACGGVNTRNPRDEALYTYVSAIRWSDFDVAVNFIDPKVLAENPITPLDIERLKQFEVSGYTVRTGSEAIPGEYVQTVEIRVINKHTQVERTVMDHQRWIWDPEAGRWWLVSGLPDFSAQN